MTELERLLAAAWGVVKEAEPDEDGLRLPPSKEAVDELARALAAFGGTAREGLGVGAD